MAWLPKKCVVVPVDFSDASLDAVKTALDMVEGPNQLHVVHVLQDISAMEPGVVWGNITDDSRISNAESTLRIRLQDLDVGDVNIHIALGSPAREIVQIAETKHADLIVIPSHGHTGIRHFLLGSVAERVARLAPCPVLILRRKA